MYPILSTLQSTKYKKYSRCFCEVLRFWLYWKNPWYLRFSHMAHPLIKSLWKSVQWSFCSNASPQHLTNNVFQNTKLDTTCYEPIADKLRENAKYWMEGVALVIVGAFGFLGNIFSMFVFRRTRGNKGFHSLLITWVNLHTIVYLWN